MSSWTKLLPHFILPSSTCYLCPSYLPPAKAASMYATSSGISSRYDHKTLPGEELGYLSSICRWAPQPTFLRIQSGRNVTGLHSETNCWQGGLGHRDWLTYIRTDLPGLRMKPFSPETRGQEEDRILRNVEEKGTHLAKAHLLWMFMSVCIHN